MREVQAWEYSTNKLQRLFGSVVKQKHGSKLLVIKSHLCSHFLENQLDFGVNSNVDTGPMESDHKCNAKKPSGQTQRHADTFKPQTPPCYTDNLILDKAVSTLEEMFSPSIFERLELPLAGAKFSIQLSNDRQDKLTIIWDKSHCIKTSYHNDHGMCIEGQGGPVLTNKAPLCKLTLGCLVLLH
jgi:hypothetical protein